MPITQQQWIYARRPQGTVGAAHYELRTQALDTGLGPGDVLIAARYFSVDPYMRIGQSARPTYDRDPHPLGVVQQGGVVGQVLASTQRPSLKATGFAVTAAGKPTPASLP